MPLARAPLLSRRGPRGAQGGIDKSERGWGGPPNRRHLADARNRGRYVPSTLQAPADPYAYMRRPPCPAPRAAPSTSTRRPRGARLLRPEVARRALDRALRPFPAWLARVPAVWFRARRPPSSAPPPRARLRNRPAGARDRAAREGELVRARAAARRADGLSVGSGPGASLPRMGPISLSHLGVQHRPFRQTFLFRQVLEFDSS